MGDFDDDVYDSEHELYGRYSSRAKRAKTYPYVQIKPVIRTNALELKDMASAVVAISLWNHVNVSRALNRADVYYCSKNAYYWSSLKMKVDDLTSELPIPESMVTQIDEYTAKVQSEIANWATYHFRSVFLNTTDDYIVYNLVSDLVWHCDGTIDCKETAKNISKSRSPRLSNVEKYRFLCMYCLKDEMHQMSPVLSNIFQDYVDFNHHPLLRYWNCFFSNALDLIPTYENASLDSFMLQHRFVDNWTAKEYFFDRLSPDDQVGNAIWLIDKHGEIYQKVLLMKLNESQRISIYLERSVQIITNYVKMKENSADVLVTWSDVRNLITREQFVSIFRELLNERADGSVLTEVWISIDDDFKNHILTYNNYEFIEKILNSYDWTKDFNFVIIILQDFNADMKRHATNQFFKNFSEKLFSHRENLQWLDRFSTAWFGENSKEFKQTFVHNSKSIQNLCFKYYSSGDVRSLNEMLTFLLSQTPDRIPEYKRNLLQSSDGISKCVELLSSESETDAVNKIIIDSLPTTDLAIEFRKKLVFSDSAIRKLQSLLTNDGLNNVKKIIDSFLTSDDDKIKLKKSLVNIPSNLISNVFRKFDESYLQSLLLWVFGEENLVKEYKKTIPMQSIFDSMLPEAVYDGNPYYYNRWGACYSNPHSYESLNRFLIWYFESLLEVKRYKLRRVHSYSNIDPITALLRKRRQKDCDRLKRVMKWFFDDDAYEIEKFNKLYKKKGKIAKII